MSEKRLTKEIAEQILVNEDFEALEEFTEIDDASAESLSKCDGCLNLASLASLSDAVATSLGKHRGESLILDGLTSLSDAVAASLGEHEDVSLGGVTTLSDAAAESLSKKKGNLYLNSLTSLSDTAAEILSRKKGNLNLEALTSLSDAAAESLSRHEGTLELDGLTSLSDRAAESLGKHQFGELSLRGDIAVTESAASSLAEHNHRVSFHGLSQNRDPGVAEIFDAHNSQFPRADKFQVTTDFKDITHDGYIRTLLGDSLSSDTEGSHVSFREFEIGNVLLPSGRITVCSQPGDADESCFARPVPPGAYPVLYAIDGPPVFACIKFSDLDVSKWEPARVEEASPRMDEPDNADGFGTDTGEGCFSSPEAHNQFLADETDDLIRAEVMSTYLRLESEVHDQLLSVMPRNKTKPPNDVPIQQFLATAWSDRIAGSRFWQVANEIGNAILFSTGGDGFHSCYFGLDHRGNVATLATALVSDWTPSELQGD